MLIKLKMSHSFLISNQSDYLTWVYDRNSHIYWQTVQIQISWLLQKPTNLDLHCLLRQGMSCSAREGLSMVKVFVQLGERNLLSDKSKFVFKVIHCSLIRVFVDCMCLLLSQGYSKMDEREPLPYWVDVQADLGLCWSHKSYGIFCLLLAHMCTYFSYFQVTQNPVDYC